MSILLFGETIMDVDTFLKKKEISNHSKKEKFILEKNDLNYGGASNLYKLLNKKKIFFFTNRQLIKKNIINISNDKIIKYRYWFKNNIVFQVNNISDKKKISLNLKNYKKIFEIIKKTKIFVISDHNYGIIKQNIFRKLIKFAQLNYIKIYYDSQLREKILNKYIPKGVDYFLMNRDEFLKYLNYYNIKKKSRRYSLFSLRKKLNAKFLILKLDKEGCVCVTEKDEYHKIEPFKKKKNLIGTGDKFLAGLVLKNNQINIKKKLIFCNKFAIK